MRFLIGAIFAGVLVSQARAVHAHRLELEERARDVAGIMSRLPFKI